MHAESIHQPGGMTTLGIIAGKGRLPQQLVDACKAMGRPCFLLSFEGADDPALLAQAPHAVVRFGAIGEALAHLRSAGVHDIVMAGTMRRPPLSTLMPDASAARLLARMGTAFFSGDDALLKAVVGFLEEEGFRIVGADSVVTELLTPAGVLGSVTPGAQALSDIAAGMQAAKELGAKDIGQAVIVRGGTIIGTEDAEGTDALIARCMPLAAGGILVKAKKPSQETRADLPAIGVHTVHNAHAASLAGIAVEAGASLLLDRAQTIADANRLGLFIVGVA